MNHSTTSTGLLKPAANPVYIAWSHFAMTSSAWQNFFRSEDEDPASRAR
ncbi:hypothetical protein [Oceanicoccus sagamiensis]|nr:hypothetical protein [Oceanicoccus sagamiensis]